MEYFTTLGTIAGVLLLGLISPGPNFIVVTSTAISISRQAGIMAGLGLAAASFTWTLLAITGLGIFITKVEWIYLTIKFIGSMYIIWIGLGLIIKARKPSKPSNYHSDLRSGFAAVRKAYLVSMTNPKSAAFFGSIFAVIFPPDAPLWVYLATLFTATFLSTFWHCGLAIFFSNIIIQQAFLKSKLVVDTVLGGFLIILGIRMLIDRPR